MAAINERRTGKRWHKCNKPNYAVVSKYVGYIIDSELLWNYYSRWLHKLWIIGNCTNNHTCISHIYANIYFMRCIGTWAASELEQFRNCASWTVSEFLNGATVPELRRASISNWGNGGVMEINIKVLVHLSQTRLPRSLCSIYNGGWRSARTHGYPVWLSILCLPVSLCLAIYPLSLCFSLCLSLSTVCSFLHSAYPCHYLGSKVTWAVFRATWRPITII